MPFASNGYARPPIAVTNMVYLCVTGVSINLPELNKKLGPRATYNPKLFPPVILRWKDPYRINSVISVSIYSTGKIICAGAKVEEQAGHIVQEILSEIPECKGRQDHAPMAIQNVVCATCMPFRLNLKRMEREDPSYASRSKLFPGLCLRHPKAGKVVLMCFETGKVNITGAKSKDEAERAFDALFDYLCQYEYRPGDEGLVDDPDSFPIKMELEGDDEADMDEFADMVEEELELESGFV
jgi:transcription initiation factor TFIID TATA-box-binding protein